MTDLTQSKNLARPPHCLPNMEPPGCTNSTTQSVTQEGDTSASVSTLPSSSSSSDAFVYIVVVLTFYALAMTILMVKYIRRENQEAQLSYYFHEFINREKFHTPRYQNRQGVTAIKRTLNKFYQSMGLVEAEKGSPVHHRDHETDDSQQHDDPDTDDHDGDMMGTVGRRPPSDASGGIHGGGGQDGERRASRLQEQRAELLEVCSVSDSGVGSEASSNHHGSSSIMVEDEDVDTSAPYRPDDDDLLMLGGTTRLHMCHPGGATTTQCSTTQPENILPQLNLLESAV